MNRFLAVSLGYLNGLLAVLTVIGGVAFGAVSLHNIDPVLGLILGGILGFIVAVIVYGGLALLIQMHRELIGIREALQRRQREGSA